MSKLWILLPLILPLIAVKSCSTMSSQAVTWQATLGEVPADQLTWRAMQAEVNIKSAFIPEGRYGRRTKRPMKARYITIHSTQNYTGDAWAHAMALQNGRLRGGVTGYLFWHFTVQEDVVVQHLPTDEMGEHADFLGPGNRQSIGIEMCEHRGNSLSRTIDRTARLTALLMHRENIPLSNVVPHYHWPREQYSTPHKDCPHFLLDRGKPKGTWRWFLSRVRDHHRRIVEDPPAG